MRAKLSRGVAIAGAAGALLVGGALTASPTSASVGNCAWGVDGPRGSYAVCMNGTGYYQSWTQCSTWYGHWYTRYGQVMWPNGTSRSSCSWGDTRRSYGIRIL